MRIIKSERGQPRFWIQLKGLFLATPLDGAATHSGTCLNATDVFCQREEAPGIPLRGSPVTLMACGYQLFHQLFHRRGIMTIPGPGEQPHGQGALVSAEALFKIVLFWIRISKQFRHPII